ncbi:MAG: hypothetical protein ACLU4J_08860 [Butyricimonas paravirosa]
MGHPIIAELYDPNGNVVQTKRKDVTNTVSIVSPSKQTSKPSRVTGGQLYVSGESPSGKPSGSKVSNRIASVS